MDESGDVYIQNEVDIQENIKEDFVSKLSVEEFTIDNYSNPMYQSRKEWRITWDVMDMKFESGGFDTKEEAVDKYKDLVSKIYNEELIFDVQACYVDLLRMK